MVKMRYPAGVRKYVQAVEGEPGVWYDADTHALVEVPDEMVLNFQSAGFTVLQDVNLGLDVVLPETGVG